MHQLIFVTAEEVLSKPILFWLKKKKTVSLIDSTCVCFCRMTVLPVFNLTHFDWLPAHFRKCSDAQLLTHFLIALTLLSSRCNFSCQISILNEFHIESEARWLFYIPILNLTFIQASSFVTVHNNWSTDCFAFHMWRRVTARWTLAELLLKNATL